MSRWRIDRPVKGGRRMGDGGRTIVVDVHRVQSGGRGIGCRCMSMSLSLSLQRVSRDRHYRT